MQKKCKVFNTKQWIYDMIHSPPYHYDEQPGYIRVNMKKIFVQEVHTRLSYHLATEASVILVYPLVN